MTEMLSALIELLEGSKAILEQSASAINPYDPAALAKTVYRASVDAED